MFFSVLRVYPLYRLFLHEHCRWCGRNPPQLLLSCILCPRLFLQHPTENRKTQNKHKLFLTVFNSKYYSSTLRSLNWQVPWSKKFVCLTTNSIHDSRETELRLECFFFAFKTIRNISKHNDIPNVDIVQISKMGL